MTDFYKGGSELPSDCCYSCFKQTKSNRLKLPILFLRILLVFKPIICLLRTVTNKQALLIMVLIFHMFSLSAQTPRRDSGADGPLTITGTVVSAVGGKPLQGVSVRIESENLRTSTKKDGSFAMHVKNRSGKVKFTYVGYKALETGYAAGIPLNVSLIPLENQLEEVEVVSTGYQKIPKERATGSFEFIDSALFNRKVSPDFVSRLEDVVPGISSVKNFNNRGSTLNIHVRGVSTLRSEPYPLIVVDGVPYDNRLADYGRGNFNNINPNDIENITVLKDAAAASIWGAQSGNGVIVITTKKGKFNTPIQLSFNANVSVKSKPDLYYYPQMSTPDYIDAQRYLFDKDRYKYRFTDRFDNVQPLLWLMYDEQQGNISKVQLETELERLRNIDLRDDFDRYIYRNAVNQQYNVQLRGGGEKVNSLFSVGYDHNRGSVVTSSGSRINLKSTTQLRPLKNLMLDIGLMYTETKNNESLIPVAYNILGKGQANYPYMELADANGVPMVVDISSYTSAYRTTAAGGKLLDWNYRPLAELYDTRETQRVRELFSNFNAAYTMGIGLKFNLLYSFKRSLSNFRQWQGLGSYYQRSMINEYASWDVGNTITWNIPVGDYLGLQHWDNQVHQGRLSVEYTKKWNEKNMVSLLGGYEVRTLNKVLTTSQYHGYDEETGAFQPVRYGERVPYMNGAFGTITISDRNRYEHLRNNYISYFANGSYAYLDRYILSASFRKDASNMFGVKSNDRGQPFWSVGAAWVLSKEHFMENAPFELLKLRTTYGYNGNANNMISAYPVMDISSTVNDITNQPYAMITRPPNPKLRWERVGITNLGLDFAWKNNLFSGSIEYYQKNAVDLIAPSQIDPSTGFSSMTMNSASLKTKGWDISLGANPIRSKNWKWNSNLVFTYGRTRVTKSYLQYDIAENFVSPNQGARVTPIKGMDLYAVLAYKWAGLDPETGEPRAFLNGEVSKDYIGIINQSTKDLENLGSTMPLYVGSFRNSLRFKNLELSWNISYQLGHHFLRNSFGNTEFINNGIGHKDYALRWQKSGDEASTDVPAFSYPHNYYASQVYLGSTALATDASQIKLRDIQLTANIPALEKYKLKNFRLYAYFQNIGTLWQANKQGIDAEYGFNIPDPLMSSLGLSFNL
ncbi:MAG: hypothetical protein K0R59_167 [Sphingobacterium sp.]|nr:hypothetical protein [Sphingobacterium sp.]